jgi:WD40 repeat protein
VGFTNGDIRGYSLTELRLIVQIKKHSDIVLSLVYIPKHDVLVSSSVDPHVYAWDCSSMDYRLKVRRSALRPVCARARVCCVHVCVCVCVLSRVWCGSERRGLQ